MKKQSTHTGKQQLLIEKNKDEVALFLDGELQFITSENHIYDSAMVDTPMRFLSGRGNLHILILGGGDGLIANKVLTYPIITSITLCEFDKEVIDFCSIDPDIRKMNNNALIHEKLEIIIEDAYAFVQKNTKRYDLILADFPDAHIEILSRLFSLEFYQNITTLLVDDGVFITVGCEVTHTRRCYDCIGNTLSTVFPYVRGYYTSMPRSYGDIGLYITSKVPLDGYIGNEIFGRSHKEINTSDNNNAFHFFDEDTKKTGFFPGITNR